jgi:hypothetical protein
MKIQNMTTTVIVLLVTLLFSWIGCSPRATSNDYIQIVGSILKTDGELKFIEVEIIFKKPATGRTYPDKAIDLISEQRRYGEVPDTRRLFYFDSDYHFKVSVDLYGNDNKLIRTDSKYYNEYRPFQAFNEVAEIVPGERKTIIFGVPKSVTSFKAWVSKK